MNQKQHTQRHKALYAADDYEAFKKAESKKPRKQQVIEQEDITT